MAVMEKCCCCSIVVIAVLGLLSSPYQIWKDAKEVIKTDEQRELETESLHLDLWRGHMIIVDRDDVRRLVDFSHYICFPDLVISIGWIVAAGCLIYGVCRKKQSFLIPAMVVFTLDAIMRLIFAMVILILLIKFMMVMMMMMLMQDWVQRRLCLLL